MVNPMTRTEKRKRYSESLRIERLEEDADGFEVKDSELSDRQVMFEERVFEELASIRKLLIGMMVSTIGILIAALATRIL